jgi:hypothetical protein
LDSNQHNMQVDQPIPKQIAPASANIPDHPPVESTLDVDKPTLNPEPPNTDNPAWQVITEAPPNQISPNFATDPPRFSFSGSPLAFPNVHRQHAGDLPMNQNVPGSVANTPEVSSSGGTALMSTSPQMSNSLSPAASESRKRSLTLLMVNSIKVLG